MMKLLSRQQRAFSLAGTVGLPAPFPAVGYLYLVFNEDENPIDSIEQNHESETESESEAEAELFEQDSGFGAETLLKIVHEVSPKVTIVRLVRLMDVSALFLPEDPNKVDFDEGTWYLEKDLIGLALSCLGEAGERSDEHESPDEVPLALRPGIVFVPETARLLHQVELGLTAAESVEYYPPLGGHRSFPKTFACGGE
jgi:hypothetical protein